ncbi:MAG TPA: hypothetical protein VJP76_05355, partial [Candidatus Tumulicola sp.]|nr:hypothetical protein [Candidatus Tumulicola sp.]
IVAAGALAPAFWSFVLLATAFGLAMGLSAGVVVVLGQEYLPQRIGIASGVTLGLSVTIGGFAAPLFGAIGDHRGLIAVFASATLFAALSLGASAFMTEPERVAA